MTNQILKSVVAHADGMIAKHKTNALVHCKNSVGVAEHGDHHETIQKELEETGIEVLLDDRDERPGVMFSDLDLLGIPYRITIGERTLSDGKVDMQARASEIPLIPIEDEMKLKVNQICDQILNIGK